MQDIFANVQVVEAPKPKAVIVHKAVQNRQFQVLTVVEILAQFVAGAAVYLRSNKASFRVVEANQNSNMVFIKVAKGEGTLGQTYVDDTVLECWVIEQVTTTKVADRKKDRRVADRNYREAMRGHNPAAAKYGTSNKKK